MSSRWDEYSKEELIEEIKKLKRQKRFGLVWEDKPEKVVKECETKLPVVKEVEEKAIENAPGEPTNIIIEGDNYHALSVLNYTHAGKIDVIYIDPPYNTENKEFIYDDRRIDGEDPFRHSKWLSFMDKRLRLARDLLADDGVIFISINDIEFAHLKMMCDSIFGEKNFIANIIWKCRNSLYYTEPTISISTEYILCYAKRRNVFYLKSFDKDSIEDGKKMEGFFFNRIKKKYDGENYTNPDNDPNGPYVTSGKVRNDGRPKYTVVSPTGVEHTEAWVYTPEVFEKLDRSGQIYWGKDGSAQPRKKSYYKDFVGNVSSNLLMDEIMRYVDDENGIKKEKYFEVGTTESGTKDLKKIIGSNSFPYPKPATLIKYLINLYPKNDSVVLDFFAGSGTTGQAVLELNREDGGCRRFILATNNEANGKADAGAEGVAEKITYPRIKTVITGTRPNGSRYSDGIPANLCYFKTDFVEKGKTTDDTREVLIAECSDMIRIRENAFEFVAGTPEYKFYKNDKVFVPIIFDQFAIAETWEKVEELNKDKLPVHCYNFSYNRHANEEEIPENTELEWTACSIPETVLETYRKIFRKKEA